jgi:hypothetical protein
MVNYIPTQRKLLLFREKRRAYRFRKFKCGQGAKSIRKRIRMDATSTSEQQNQNRVRKIFTRLKTKHNRRKKKSGTRDQHGTYGKQDY